jgi:hypothetical protein
VCGCPRSGQRHPPRSSLLSRTQVFRFVRSLDQSFTRLQHRVTSVKVGRSTDPSLENHGATKAPAATVSVGFKVHCRAGERAGDAPDRLDAGEPACPARRPRMRTHGGCRQRARRAHGELQRRPHMRCSDSTRRSEPCSGDGAWLRRIIRCGGGRRMLAPLSSDGPRTDGQREGSPVPTRRRTSAGSPPSKPASIPGTMVKMRRPRAPER